MIHLASGTGSAEACIDLTKWVHRPLRVRQTLRGYYQLFVKLGLIQLKVKKRRHLEKVKEGEVVIHMKPKKCPGEKKLTLLIIPVKTLCFWKNVHVPNEN